MRGLHSCRECDFTVVDAVRRHALSQDIGVFLGLNYNSRATWRKVEKPELSVVFSQVLQNAQERVEDVLSL